MTAVWTGLGVAAAVLVGLVVAEILRRRRPAPPAQPIEHVAPAQLDRDDFDRPDAPWLVVVFSSLTCEACAGVVSRAEILRSDSVAVADIDAVTGADLHARYSITGVPTTVISDASGVVVRSFLGPVSSTHLWAAVAEARQPGSVPGGCSDPE
jgi:hypothetical protein